MPYRLEAMQLKDIPEVIQVERDSFSMTWPANSYKRELEQNRMARYVVLRYAPEAGESPAPSLREHRRPFPLSLLPHSAERVAEEIRYPMAGYGGLWLMVDEAHVTSVAVRPEYRGRGLGELLMFALFDIALSVGARWITLEVRVSNTIARRLYEKLGFRETGTRPRYYTDNNEDAVIMWSEELKSAQFRERYRRVKAELAQRIKWTSAL